MKILLSFNVHIWVKSSVIKKLILNSNVEVIENCLCTNGQIHNCGRYFSLGKVTEKWVEPQN